MNAKQYRGLDIFRVFAAVLVIANHTAPLISYHPSANFFVTRILARLAVPFFFMVTGQFVLSDLLVYAQSSNKVREYLKKTMLVYGGAMLLYLPIGIYAGIYQKLTIESAIRLLLFDGTFYHLWYFPASMLGILLLVWLRKWLSIRSMFMLCSVLYGIGLLGDSYYGLIPHGTALYNGYEYAFQLFSYTRNGLFFAPLFLLLGAAAGQKESLLKTQQLTFGFLISFLLLTAEAYLVYQQGLSRHDSMYVMLIPAMIFLYQALLSWKGKAIVRLRSFTSIIYIIHPAMIVAFRGIVKLLDAEELLVHHSLIQFFVVTGSTMLAAFVLTFLPKWRKKEQFQYGRAWIELDLQALKQNVRVLRSCLPAGCKLMPAIKANAYGHGAVLIARKLAQLGVDAFCVACIEEAIELRKNGIHGEILILGYTHPKQFSLLQHYRLTQTVVDYPYAKELNQYGKKIHVHIAIDTGMHRLGERCEHIDEICAMYAMDHLIVDGIFSHLAAADGSTKREQQFTQSQIEAWNHVLAALEERGCSSRKHLLGSYGMFNYPALAGDYVRVGIALYGVLSTKYDNAIERALQPVLSLKARVAIVKQIHQHESVGYGMDFTADRDMKIATIAIGYADGLPRSLSNGAGEVLIGGCKAPIIGRICMDQTIVDVSGIPDVNAGDTAILLGGTGAHAIHVTDWAEKTCSISNEILSRLGSRLDRKVISQTINI